MTLPKAQASDLAQSNLLVERREGVAIITMNRPRERNPLGLDFPENMLRILDELENDYTVHAIVLTGAGEAFCAGADLGKVVHPDGIDGERQFRNVRDFNKVVQRIRDLDLPVIAAINGAAVGGGVGIAMACDIAIASEEASYYFAFGRVGASAADVGCAYFLPKIVGTIRAKHWVLTGATVKAAEGKATGLFIDVVPRSKLLEHALRIAAQIKNANPRRAAAASKLAIVRGEDADLQTCITYESYVQNYLFTQDEHKSRLKVLMGKVKPK
jgi:enoyl-CoA hydratase/carnithine racemase